MPTLSICIPTYTRAKCLAELLDSILAQNHPDLEVIVSDDCSKDDTAAAVASYQPKFKKLVYIRQDPNIGLDRNFLAVIAAATNDYIWLCGDDDRFEPNGIATALAQLDAWPGVSGMTVGVIDYNHDFSKVTGLRYMPPTGRLATLADVFRAMAEQLGFMSALIVDRRKWETVVREDPIFDFQNYYIQVYITGRIIQRFGDWGVLHTPVMGYRSDNDQFLSQMGWFKRLKMDVTAYTAIGEALLDGDRETLEIMRRRVFHEHIRSRITNIKTADGPTPQIGEAIRLLFDNYKDIPQFWTSTLPMLLAPKWAMRTAKSLYKTYSPSSGAQRAKALAS